MRERGKGACREEVVNVQVARCAPEREAPQRREGLSQLRGDRESRVSPGNACELKCGQPGKR